MCFVRGLELLQVLICKSLYYDNILWFWVNVNVTDLPALIKALQIEMRKLEYTRQVSLKD